MERKIEKMEKKENKEDTKMKKQFRPVRPKIDVTNQCNRCKKFYEDKDVAMLEEGAVCLNCLDTKDPNDIHKMLKVGFQQEDILTIRELQYPCMTE